MIWLIFCKLTYFKIIFTRIVLSAPKDSKNLFMGKNGKKYNPKPPLSIISILLIKHERDRRNFPISANPPKMNLWNLFKFVSSRLKTAKIPPSLLRIDFFPPPRKICFPWIEREENDREGNSLCQGIWTRLKSRNYRSSDRSITTNIEN